MIPDDDRGLLLGDGLFETLLAVDGALQAWAAHIARMRRGCGVLGLEPPQEAGALAAAEAALDRAGLKTGRAAVRLTLTAGSGRGLDRPAGAAARMLASASPAAGRAEPLRLATVAVRRNAASPVSRLKTLSYLDNVLARREARALGADEALMLNTSGEVACCAAANLFWIASGRLCTPAIDCGVLDGTVRAEVLAEAIAMGVEVHELQAGPEALGDAEAMFVTNSLMGVVPVAALDGRTLGGDALVGALSRSRR